MATTPLRTFRVDFAVPPGPVPSSVTVLVGYRGDLVSLPGSGAVSSVRTRVKNLPSNSFPAVNDLDYALRVVVSRGAGVSPGRLFTVDFDSCQSAVVPTEADFGCAIEGCGSSSGPVDGCSCSTSAP
jgi:hypothetical protein